MLGDSLCSVLYGCCVYGAGGEEGCYVFFLLIFLPGDYTEGQMSVPALTPPVKRAFQGEEGGRGRPDTPWFLQTMGGAGAGSALAQKGHLAGSAVLPQAMAAETCLLPP